MGASYPTFGLRPLYSGNQPATATATITFFFFFFFFF
jgi:hypothetical protein